MDSCDPLDGSEAMANTEPSESPSASVALRSPDAVESSLMDALVSPETTDIIDGTDGYSNGNEKMNLDHPTDTWNESNQRSSG